MKPAGRRRERAAEWTPSTGGLSAESLPVWWARARGGLLAALLSVAALLGGPLTAPGGPLTAQELPGEEVRAESWHHTSPRTLGLEEAVRIALQASPSLESTRSGLEVAHSRRLEAYGGFLPSVDVGYAYANSSTGRLDPTGQEITNTSWSTQISAGYDLFSGFSRITGARAARRRATAAEARHDEALHRVRLDTKTAWYQAVAAGDLVRVEARRVERQQSQADSVEVQLAMGRVARPDLLRSQVALNNARMALIRARSAARAADLALARTIGLNEPVTPRREEVPDPVPLALDLDELLAAALDRGPTVRGAKAEAEAASSDVRRAASRYLPSLSIQGGWAWSASEFPPSRGSWRVGISGGLPIFDGFSRETRLDEARAASNVATAQERMAELQLREDLSAAYDLVQAGLEGVQLVEQTVELSREELEMQQERFRLGRGALFEVQEAETGLARAEADRVQARFDYHQGRAQLEYLLGSELEDLERGTGEGAGP